MPVFVNQRELQTSCVSWGNIYYYLPLFKTWLLFYSFLSSRWALIDGKKLCIVLCEDLSDLQGTVSFGACPWGHSLHYTSQPCCVQSTCWQRQHSSISSALGLRIRDASDHPAGQLCLLRVFLGIRHHGAQQYLQDFMPLSEVLSSGRSASRHFFWSDSPGNTNCCVKFYTLGQLRCLSSRQAKSYEAWLGKSFLRSLRLWYLPQTGEIHWDISATRNS